MRKVVGAHRRQIVGQFLGESILLSTFAHLFAVLMVHLSLPWVSSWMGITLSIAQAGFWFLLILPGSVLIIGFLAGSCPAFLISRFKPITALKGHLVKDAGGTSLRRGLVLFQFSISVLLIAGTWVVFSQWQFMVGKDPGYDKENVVILPFPGGDPTTVRQRFLTHPNILYACVTNGTPVGATDYRAVRPEGKAETWRMHQLDLSESVLSVFGIKLLQGRDFSADIRSDRQEAYMLNESAVKALGWKDPIGKTFRTTNWPTGHVIGVVKDFHFKSLQQEIKPLFLKLQGAMANLSLRVNSKNLVETMAFIQQTWKDVAPHRPFEYEFLDQRLEAVYRADMKASQMFSVAAVLAILIACLGLVGLASFSTQQRTKEIGIRKVLGATTPNLVALFTREFIKLVSLANLLMMPVSVYFTRMWLDQFAYRIEPGPWPFVLSAGLSLLIAALTVCLIAFRAATKDPVDALRNE
jgi:putative ABC transport system permease protein